MGNIKRYSRFAGHLAIGTLRRFRVREPHHAHLAPAAERAAH
jgi:hypothetical protein